MNYFHADRFVWQPFMLYFCNSENLVSGTGRLDDESYYRDNIHLDGSGLLKYFEYIEKTLNYCYMFPNK